MALNETGHFTRMEPLFGPLAGALRHALLHWKISENFPKYGPAPKTEYRAAVIENSKNPLRKLIERLIADPDEPLIGEDVIHGNRFEMLTDELAKKHGSAIKMIHSMGFTKWKDVSVVNGARTEIYVHSRKYIPELADPDEMLEERIGDGM
jgi:hypothetical protein